LLLVVGAIDAAVTVDVCGADGVNVVARVYGNGGVNVAVFVVWYIDVADGVVGIAADYVGATGVGRIVVAAGDVGDVDDGVDGGDVIYIAAVVPVVGMLTDVAAVVVCITCGGVCRVNVVVDGFVDDTVDVGGTVGVDVTAAWYCVGVCVGGMTCVVGGGEVDIGVVVCV